MIAAGPRTRAPSEIEFPIPQSRATAGSLSAVAAVSVGGFPTPPLTYAWTRVAGATSLVTATPASGSTNTTTFNATLALGQSINETYRVTVTDAVGRIGTDDVVVSFSASASPMNIAITPAEPGAYRSDAGPLSTSATVTQTGGVSGVDTFAHSLRTTAGAWPNGTVPYRLDSTSNTFIQRVLTPAYGSAPKFNFNPFQAPGYGGN